MKSVTFVLSSAPYSSDRNYQAARMALAMSADCGVRVVLAGPSCVLASGACSIDKKAIDYAEQERFLVETEVPVYVVENDLGTYSIDMGDLRSHVIAVDLPTAKTMIRESDAVFFA